MKTNGSPAEHLDDKGTGANEEQRAEQLENITDIRKLGTIMGIWAHPDDETFFSAGIMATAVRNGQRVVCVNATYGEGGTDETRIDLADTRKGELSRALGILGVEEYFLLGYRDGQCSEVPEEEVVDRIAECIGQVQPDSILTFGPDGWTRHPDHVAVNHWVEKALQKIASQAKLYFVTTTPEIADKFGPPEHPKGYHSVGGPSVTPKEQLAINFPISSGLWQLKQAAILSHQTQIKGIVDAFGQEWLDRENQGEYYRAGN
jgi:LmbE family N-acetylglucosaminyl deacetylase